MHTVHCICFIRVNQDVCFMCLFLSSEYMLDMLFNTSGYTCVHTFIQNSINQLCHNKLKSLHACLNTYVYIYNSMSLKKCIYVYLQVNIFYTQHFNECCVFYIIYSKLICSQKMICQILPVAIWNSLNVRQLFPMHQTLQSYVLFFH